MKTKEVILGQDDRPLKLKWLDEKTAIVMAQGMFNRDTLQRWLDEEVRHKVKKLSANRSNLCSIARMMKTAMTWAKTTMRKILSERQTVRLSILFDSLSGVL